MKIANRNFVYFISIIMMGHFAIAQEDTIQKKIINVFQFPSIQRTVLVEGGGYFPIVNVVGNQLFTVFRTGAGHLGRGGALSFSVSPFTGETWSAPQTIVDSTQDDRNPAVGLLPNHRIVIGYHEQGSYTDEGKYDPTLHRMRTMLTWSDDQGKTWASPKPLGIPEMESCSPYGRMVNMPDGTLIMSVYEPSVDNHENAYLIRSKDYGETWSDPSLILSNHNETALLLLSDGRLLAASRGNGPMQRMDTSISADGGYTWSSPLRITGRMQHPADLLILSNGWILLVYGDRSQEEKVIRGIISRDSARTWDFSYEIEFSRPVRGDFGYPSAVRFPEGQLGLVYYSAGAASNAYDGTKTNAFLIQFHEQELIDSYTNLLTAESR